MWDIFILPTEISPVLVLQWDIVKLGSLHIWTDHKLCVGIRDAGLLTSTWKGPQSYARAGNSEPVTHSLQASDLVRTRWYPLKITQVISTDFKESCGQVQYNNLRANACSTFDICDLQMTTDLETLKTSLTKLGIPFKKGVPKDEKGVSQQVTEMVPQSFPDAQPPPQSPFIFSVLSSQLTS